MSQTGAKLKVLMASSEVAPFAKVGGLADVVGVLPKALQDTGELDCRVIMPLYKQIKDRYRDELEFLRWSMQRMGWRQAYTGLFRLWKDGVCFYFIDNEFYFYHDQIYLDYSFDIERYVFFQRAVLDCLGEAMDFWPDVLHCHDWQTGLIPCLLDAHYRPAGYFRELKTVYTIHNLKYQGIHGQEWIQDLCDLSPAYMTDFGLLKDGAPNFMKAGIVYSDAVTTVSPTYAEEILSPYYGEGLDGLLRGYAYKLRGILNGIDLEEYNPQTDPYLGGHNYGLENWREAKAALKRELHDELGFSCPTDWPLAVMISRLVDQKGLDLLLHVLDELLDYNVQIAVLGTGDPRYEEALRTVAARRPDRFAACITFNNALAHRFYAASDLFLMPSLFEPCGLSQLIAMRYGSLPIVRETGGLRDTVQAYNQHTAQGNGFSFRNINAHEFLFVSQYAIDCYWRAKEHWPLLVEHAMTGDYSWTRAAGDYLDLYRQICG